MPHEERISDLPASLRWFLVAFKQVGFPVLVCAYLAYMQFVDGKDQRKSLGEFKDVMLSLKATIDQQNRILLKQ